MTLDVAIEDGVCTVKVSPAREGGDVEVATRRPPEYAIAYAVMAAFGVDEPVYCNEPSGPATPDEVLS